MNHIQVIYDGKCMICQSSVAWLRKRDQDGILEFSPLQKPEILLLYDIPYEEAMLEMQAIINGVRYRGAEAVIRVVSCLPRYRWMQAGIRWKWFLRIAAFIYRQIAKRRYLFDSKTTG